MMDSRPRLHGGRLCAGMTRGWVLRGNNGRGVPCAGITERGGSAWDDGEGEGGFETHPYDGERRRWVVTRDAPTGRRVVGVGRGVGLTVKVDGKILA